VPGRLLQRLGCNAPPLCYPPPMEVPFHTLLQQTIPTVKYARVCSTKINALYSLRRTFYYLRLIFVLDFLVTYATQDGIWTALLPPLTTISTVRFAPDVSPSLRMPCDISAFPHPYLNLTLIKPRPALRRTKKEGVGVDLSLLTQKKELEILLPHFIYCPYSDNTCRVKGGFCTTKLNNLLNQVHGTFSTKGGLPNHQSRPQEAVF